MTIPCPQHTKIKSFSPNFPCQGKKWPCLHEGPLTWKEYFINIWKKSYSTTMIFWIGKHFFSALKYTVFLSNKILTNVSCLYYLWFYPPPPHSPEVEFLDEIQTKALRVFLLAIHSHLYSFALRFLFLQTHATSHSFYCIRCKGEGGKPDSKPYPLPSGSRNPCRNVKSVNYKFSYTGLPLSSLLQCTLEIPTLPR